MNELDNYNTLEDLFKLSIYKTLELTKVAVLCRVIDVRQAYDSKKGYQLINVTPIPTNDGSSLIAYAINDASYAKDELALVIFTDLYFGDKINLAEGLSTEAKDTTRHARKNALIIKLNVGSGGEITVDDNLSTTSKNPVQNKVITSKINEILEELSKTLTHNDISDWDTATSGFLTKIDEATESDLDNIWEV